MSKFRKIHQTVLLSAKNASTVFLSGIETDAPFAETASAAAAEASLSARLIGFPAETAAIKKPVKVFS